MDMGVLHLDSSQIQGSMVWSLEAVSRLFGFRRVPQANCCFTGHYPKRFNKDVQPILHVWIQEIGITSTGNKREDGPQVIIVATKQNNYFQINSWIAAKKKQPTISRQTIRSLSGTANLTRLENDFCSVKKTGLLCALFMASFGGDCNMTWGPKVHGFSATKAKQGKKFTGVKKRP